MSQDPSNHYLDKYGCSFGQVNRSRLEDVEVRVNTICSKLNWLLLLLIGQLTISMFYLLTHWRPIP